MTTETSPLLSAKAESYGGTEADRDKERMARMEENMDQMKNELKTRDQRISLLEEALGSQEELEEEMAVLRETVDEVRNQPYAFQCASSNISSYNNDHPYTITYEKLLYSSMNIEGGFNVTTGIFTAGYSGTWRISASAFMTLAQY